MPDLPLALNVVVNGVEQRAEVPVRMLLTDYSRHRAGLTRTYVGCEHGGWGRELGDSAPPAAAGRAARAARDERAPIVARRPAASQLGSASGRALERSAARARSSACRRTRCPKSASSRAARARRSCSHRTKEQDNMNVSFAGNVAVVTGASKGIGLAIVRALVEHEATVVAGARTPSDELRALTPHVVAGDLAVAGGPERLIDYALAEAGAVNVLVNNVGGNPAPVGGFLSVSDDDWRDVLELNLMTVVRATRAALPSLTEQRGAIVNVASANARLAQPAVVAYGAAKAAVLNLGKALADELGPQGVRVNTVSPGPVLTPLWTDAGSPGAAMATAMGMTTDELVAQLPGMAGMTTGRMASADEVAAFVLLLASDAFPSVRGADIVVDGGLLKAI
jgi:NAD(P)-dependent dehydrogenase (short-subunit alcohol dehydrogenase family)